MVQLCVIESDESPLDIEATWSPTRPTCRRLTGCCLPTLGEGRLGCVAVGGFVPSVGLWVYGGL